MHGCSRMTVDPRIPRTLGRSTSGFHRPGRYSFFARLGHMTIDHASLSRRSTFLLLIETPPTIGRSSRCFHILHTTRNFWLVLSPSCEAVCGHHLSPRTAIVFSLLSSVSNSSMSHSGGGGRARVGSSGRRCNRGISFARRRRS